MKYKIKVELARAARKLDILVNVDDPCSIVEEFTRVGVAADMLAVLRRFQSDGADEQMLRALKSWNRELTLEQGNVCWLEMVA